MLRNAPIRWRFAFTLIVPLLGLAVLAVGGIRADLVESAKAARVHRLARFGAELAPVIHGLQDERSLSGNYLAVGRRAGAAELAARDARSTGPLPPTGPQRAGSAWAGVTRPSDTGSMTS